MFQSLITRQDRRLSAAANPWHALWAMMVGFFMILVDATIVAVANPSLMDNFGADYDAVIWVTSAYLLAYAVPLLVAGRLGDRFGPKNLYLLGLTVFTVASLWCGLSHTIGMLIAARVVQGIGAALLTPQTLSTITRLFPAARRGVAMGVWGATAGVATLIGPLAGGVLIDALGWQWIFFVNVPVGVVGVVLALRLVPDLPVNKHRFDIPGVVLSGVGMFMIVFALQEGQSADWAPWVWGTIAGGVGFMAAFLIWQSVNTREPLIPLVIFRDRDFSLSSLGVATIGFVVTAMLVPVMFYAQAVCGLSPTRSALLIAPMAIATGVLAPIVGRIVDRSHPRPVIGFGFSTVAIAMTWLSIEMTPTTPIWRLALPLTATGIGMAFIWSPLAATATRNLPLHRAGAGSGVYNSTRQVGSVLGSACLAAFLSWRVNAEMPTGPAEAPRNEGAVTELPAFLHDPFSAAMSQTLLLPAFVALFGVVAALFLLGFDRQPQTFDDEADEADDAQAHRDTGFAVEYGGDETVLDDDDYLEYTVTWDEPASARRPPDDREPATEPLRTRPDHLLAAPAEAWHSDPVYSWHSLLEGEEPIVPEEPAPVSRQDSWQSILELLLADDSASKPEPKPDVEPIGFAHNGFHVDERERFQRLGRHPESIAEPRSPVADAYSADHRAGAHERPGRHHASGERPGQRPFWFESNGRHSRDDGASRHGRHSAPWHD